MPALSYSQWYTSAHDPEAKVWAMQEPGALEAIAALVGRLHPRLIIELGTYSGGLTLAMAEAAPLAQLHSFDLRNHDEPHELVSDQGPPAKRSWFPGHVFFHRDDVLAPSLTVARLLATPYPKLLYCDNGDKPKELRLYAHQLHAGDVLGVHDWPTDINPANAGVALNGFDPIEHDRFHDLDLQSRFWLRRSPPATPLRSPRPSGATCPDP